jgi:hypothetical protein
MSGAHVKSHLPDQRAPQEVARVEWAAVSRGLVTRRKVAQNRRRSDMMIPDVLSRRLKFTD